VTDSSITRDSIAPTAAPAVLQLEETDRASTLQNLLAEADQSLRTAAGPYQIHPASDPRWAQLVANHPRASLFHDPRWLRALEAAYGYRPLVLTTTPAGMPLRNGIVFCEINSVLTGRRLVSLPFSDHCEPLTSEPDDLDPLLLEAEQEVDAGRYRRFEIRPVFYRPGKGTRLCEDHAFAIHWLNLRLPIETIYRGFHKDCIQRKIRRAERENLQYEDGNSEELLQKFLRLMTMTRRRHGLPPQPLRWFRALMAAFGKDLKIRIASKDGVPVASILTISHRRTMVYKYGCSDQTANRFGGTPMLFWRTIQEAKENDQDQLDMGRSDADDEGLITFKEHWGALPSKLQYWNYPGRELGASNSWLKKVGRTAIAVAPDFALQKVGSLMYRHMG
jgi:CelD/BcsL family acetyltransferase involved in cellulose biosynthesis